MTETAVLERNQKPNPVVIDEAIEFLLCKKNPAYFIFKYCYTVDQADNKIKLIPDYPYLRDLIKNLITDEFLLIEKSRQMIISWTISALMLHRLIFKTNSSSFNVSRKEDFVDDKTVASILGKIDFMYHRLPAFLQPVIERSYLKIICPGRESIIAGESANENAGRGGAYDLVVIDEASFIPRGETVFSSLRQACKRKLVLNSTPNGKTNFFARLRFQAVSSFKILTLHWRLHPERNDAWYEAQKKDMTPLQIARELDLSYEDSLAGRVFSFNSTRHIEKYDEARIRELIKKKNVFIGADFGYADPTVFLFMVYDDDKAYVFDEYKDVQKTPDIHAKKVLDIMKKWDIKTTTIYGDPAGNTRGQGTGVSLFSDYGRNGVHIIAGNNEVQAGIRKIELCLVNNKLSVFDNCPMVIDALSEATFPVDRNGRTTKESYIHDVHSHPNDALRYVLLSSRPLEKTPKNWEQAELEVTNPYTGY